MRSSESLIESDFDFESFFSMLEKTLVDTRELVEKIENMPDSEDPPDRVYLYSKGQPSSKFWLDAEGRLHRLKQLPAALRFGFEENLVSIGFLRHGNYWREDNQPTEIWLHKNRNVALLQWHDEDNELHNEKLPAEISLDSLEKLECFKFLHHGQPVSIGHLPAEVDFTSMN